MYSKILLHRVTSHHALSGMVAQQRGRWTCNLQATGLIRSPVLLIGIARVVQGMQVHPRGRQIFLMQFFARMPNLVEVHPQVITGGWEGSKFRN